MKIHYYEHLLLVTLLYDVYVLLIYLFILHHDQRFPSLLSPYSLPPHPIHCSSDSLQKGTGLPWLLTKHSISSCIKTKHPCLYSDGTRQSRMKNRLEELVEALRTANSPIVKSSTSRPSYITVIYI